MASANGAQREPSMEEILASIRRIIEDGEAGSGAGTPAPAVAPVAVAPAVVEAPRAPLIPPSPAPVAVAPAVAVAPPTLVAPAAAAPSPAAPVAIATPPAPETRPQATVIEVEAFRSELRDPAQAVAPEQQRRPVTLSEVQAQVAAEQVAAREAAERAYREAPAVTVKPAPQVQNRVIVDTTRPTDPSEWHLGVGKVRGPGTEAQQILKRREASVNAVIEEASRDPRVAAPPVVVAPAIAAAADPVAEPIVASDAMAVAQSRHALMSEQVGKQVAAAFGELSDAFSGRARKSLEAMTEDMLRPMLQDWLDNNLPVIVERLVREEIERVARGS